MPVQCPTRPLVRRECAACTADPGNRFPAGRAARAHDWRISKGERFGPASGTWKRECAQRAAPPDQIFACSAPRSGRGAIPGTTPALEQATAFETVVNLKAAKALGVTIPTAILLRADEVIE